MQTQISSKYQRSKVRHSGGYVTLVLMIIVGAMAFAIALSAITGGVSAAKTGFSFMQLSQARSYATGCVEQALYKVHNGDIVVGSTDTGTDTFSNGTCSYFATVSALGDMTVNASGFSVRSKTDIIIEGTVSGGRVTITSWR